MNILRWKRKSKKKVKLKTLVLFIFSLIMTTFAWFAYSKVINPTLNIHVSSWNMEYYIGETKQTNPISLEIPVLYPAMPEQTVKIDIKNNGETLVDIEYVVESLSIAGTSYEVVQEGRINTTDKYVIITPSAYATDKVNGTITNDITKFPFTIEIEHSTQVAAAGQGYLTVHVNWIGDDNDLDSEWGYIVGDYFIDNPTATSAMTIGLRIDSYQADPLGTTITETLPSTTETTPYLPTGFHRVPGTNLESGLVIKDASGNEYVWVEVPKNTAVYSTAGLTITEFTTDEYTKIETDLKTYSGAYNTRDDVYSSYNAIAISDENYPILKQKMLKSIYQNGGFYVGRYETGISAAEGPRVSYSSSDPTQTPIIQANAYPYNFVSCSQAQLLASRMASGDYTSGLMFGLQWDLILKYIETKELARGNNQIQAELATDSTSWGNYTNSEYEMIRPNAKYLLSTASTWADTPHSKTEEESLLMTTGGNSSILSKQNIYDIAGNLSEWTLNIINSEGKSIGGNGGDYTPESSNVATYRASYNAATGVKHIGFRVTIF